MEISSDECTPGKSKPSTSPLLHIFCVGLEHASCFIDSKMREAFTISVTGLSETLTEIHYIKDYMEKCASMPCFLI